jgi:hypothetical protein
MARIEELFTILRTLINSTTESTIAINKCTLSTVITCLQVTHKKIDMFKHQNKLLSDELSLLRHQQCDFNNQNDIKDENEDIQLTSDESHKHEDQLDEVPMSEKVADKCIVRPWEELRFKRNRYGLGYENDANNLFHFPNYSEPVCFVSGGFLNDDKTTELADIGKEQVQDIVDDDVANRSDKEPIQCKHCHRFGHDKSNCFDLHPCKFCGKTNHPSVRCQKRKRKQIHFEWLGNWRWRLEANLLEQSYHRIYTQVQSYLIGDISTVDGHECFSRFDDLGYDRGPVDVVF